MPLRDHFHPPLTPRFPWTSFHTRWTTAISDLLNEQLPDNYTALPCARFNVEIDVATLELEPSQTQIPPWSPEAPLQTLPVIRRTDVIEVLVFAPGGEPRLVGAIELVSPANKDAPDSRAAFVAKCVSILESGAGLLVVDVVTGRHATFHAEILTRFTGSPVTEQPGELYAASYRPIRTEEHNTVVQIWPHELAIGRQLPVLPLWLAGGLAVRVDLQTTYEETCRRIRIPPG